MNPRTTPRATVLTPIARFARRVAGFLAECDHAQRRMLADMIMPDGYLPDSDRAPHTYAEFLFRTAGPSLREPAAARRAGGRPVGQATRPGSRRPR